MDIKATKSQIQPEHKPKLSLSLLLVHQQQIADVGNS